MLITPNPAKIFTLTHKFGIRMIRQNTPALLNADLQIFKCETGIFNKSDISSSRQKIKTKFNRNNLSI